MICKQKIVIFERFHETPMVQMATAISLDATRMSSVLAHMKKLVKDLFDGLDSCYYNEKNNSCTTK